jgi:GNAT superfamily N-acetyltransferase
MVEPMASASSQPKEFGPSATAESLQVGPADRDDADALLYLQRLAYLTEAELYRDWRIPPLTESVGELRREFDRQLILKAWLTHPRRIIGSVRVRRDDGTAHIGRLIVHPDHQRRGLGTALLGAAERSVLHAQRFELFTGNRSTRNLSLYQKQGYHPFREERVSARLTLVFLEKLARP